MQGIVWGRRNPKNLHARLTVWNKRKKQERAALPHDWGVYALILEKPNDPELPQIAMKRLQSIWRASVFRPNGNHIFQRFLGQDFLKFRRLWISVV